MYQRPKLESYRLPVVTRPHIFRDPPKSVHTRKYEPVSEADTLYNIRSSQTGQDRISEAISYYARGTNPMVDVDYGNSAGNGARTLSLPSYNPGNVYKAFRDGAFRPPIYTMDALLPLSRMKYLNPAAATNPSTYDQGVNPTLSSNIDRHVVVDATAGWTNTSAVQAQPSLSYKVALPGDIFDSGMVPDPRYGLRADEKILQGSWTTPKAAPDFTASLVSDLHRSVMPSGSIVLTPLTASAATNLSVGLASSPEEAHDSAGALGTLKSTNKQLILGAVKSNFALVVVDNSTGRNTQLTGTIQDKQSIAVQAALGNPLTLTDRTTGEPIRVKDYRWKVIQSATGSDALVISISPDQDVTQQKLRDISLEAKVSGGAVSSAVHNMNSGAATSYHDGVQSLQSRSTNAQVLHTAGPSMFQSSQAENTRYQGGSSINDRQAAATIMHQRKEARRARASDVRGSINSTAQLPMNQERMFRLKTSKEAVRV